MTTSTPSPSPSQTTTDVPQAPAQPTAAELDAWVRAAFEPGGPLEAGANRYLPRQAQLQMARAVARAIAERQPLVVEAGTGVGKTFAYLVPALLSGCRVLVSTATKSLQDQLYMRDLPRLIQALSLPLRTALLKGRSSYLCWYRLEQARHSEALPDRRAVAQLARIELWSQGTRTGDFAEIDGLDERSPVLPLVSSTRDNCLGNDCPRYRDCHVVRARREAMEADVVVVNHHLFFADLVLRDTGVAELLPSVDVAIFDEAHQLTEAGLAFLGKTLGSAQLFDVARDIIGGGLTHARGMHDWQALAGGIESAARELRLAVVDGEAPRITIKLRWEQCRKRPDLHAALASVQCALEDAEAALQTVQKSHPDMTRLTERCTQLQGMAQLFSAETQPGHVRWVDCGAHHVRLVESPLDVREALNEQRERGGKAWIFTSATLGEDDALRWFTEPTGLEDAATLKLGSPFDYAAHGRLYVPRGCPKPGGPEHPLAVAELAARCAAQLGGRTFVLTTTLRALQDIGSALEEKLQAMGQTLTVLVQGRMPKRQLLQRFVSEPNSVLVGSASFWEGIDVAGDALQCVIIDKLPFPPPGDPMVEAWVQRLEAQGRNAFSDYFVAEAAIALKQGGGRLIRTESDRGLLVVCDPRLAGMHYGKRLRAALPPMALVPNLEAALEWLGQLRADHGAAEPGSFSLGDLPKLPPAFFGR
ncbi:ATP-dependent DNA helicase [Roseateles sp. BYS180W]|uniref:DNA 5'-3' helicase n=1 Tax=Roseateles rivi TaxID=3299028 RepID=A0ABW7FVV2_9BURK